MRRSIGLLASVVVLGAIGSLAVREVSVRASQPLTPDAEQVAIDPMEKADQMASPDCAQLTRLALRAEVNVLGVKYASASEPQALAHNINELQTSVHQLQSFAFSNPQVDRLRSEYATLLQPLLNNAQSPQAVQQQVQQVTQFNRERILFDRCQVS